MIPFLSIMGWWSSFLKTQRTNIGLWDGWTIYDKIPDLAYRSTGKLQAEWSRFFVRTLAFVSQAVALQAQGISITPTQGGCASSRRTCLI